MLPLLFVTVGSRLVGEELPLFVAMFGKLCMYCSGVQQVSISLLVITPRLRSSVSCILSLSVGCVSVFICLHWEPFGKAWWCFLVFIYATVFVCPLYFCYLCPLERDFLLLLFVALVYALLLLCQRVNRFMFCFLRYIRLAIGYFS